MSRAAARAHLDIAERRLRLVDKLIADRPNDRLAMALAAVSQIVRPMLDALAAVVEAMPDASRPTK